MRLVLASGSPRRADLLRAAGYDFEIIVTDVDEAIRPDEQPEIYVRRLAAEKSAAASASVASGVPPPLDPKQDELRRDQAEAQRAKAGSRTVGPPRGGGDDRQPVILGADTVVVVDGEILGKPRDDAQAEAMLRLLSGKRHMVVTGVSLRQGANELGRVEQTSVYFRALSADDVAWYVASGEGRDKAGAYAIQGLASRFIPRIDGSYSNVVGLPVAAVAELLTSLLASGR
jgi:septum formation protein